MSELNEAQFRRVFRFHPTGWREEHEAVAVGVLMDAAEAMGKSKVGVSEKLSLYAHAAHIRANEFMSTTARATLASLALGTGIGLAAAYFGLFTVRTFLSHVALMREFGTEVFPAGITIWDIVHVSGVVMAVLWAAAAVAVMLKRMRAARWIAMVIGLTCLIHLAIRLFVMDLLFFDTLVTPLFFAAWALLASLSQARRTLVLQAAGVVAILFGTYGVFNGYWTDLLMWASMVPWLVLGLIALAVVAIVAAMLGRGAFATLVTLYAAPWAILLLLAHVQGNRPRPINDVAVMATVWVVCSLLVFGITRLRNRGAVGA